eukprot:CAMPEP_0183508570 /NCGR_PEP_ID=MMETSP0371-20130417/8956_1 /TAXON_ID=268820 /ORGANISM="Peridinium aciculiferum, Strain PAER-2" /LENGTH=133 /DNA_ID=CAMNT_0025704977 /DNA_START=159 /DNA_END=558 /DNA_ORIENTATION=-
MTNEVTQSGDEIGVVSWSPKGTFTNMLRIDGSKQETADPVEGRPIRVVLAWEALLVDAGAAPVPALVTRGRRLDVGEHLPENSHFLHGEEESLRVIAWTTSCTVLAQSIPVARIDLRVPAREMCVLQTSPSGL